MPASALVRRVLLGLLAANLVVVGAKLAVGIASQSLAVFGGALDSSVDALNNLLALIVACVLVLGADRLLVRTILVLVDQRAIPTRHIQETAQAVPGVKSAYAIRSRGPSDLRYAEVTIAVDRHANVESAHAIADEVEDRLKRDLQLHEVTVHIEPC